jgi:hypothetical protein
VEKTAKITHRTGSIPRKFLSTDADSDSTAQSNEWFKQCRRMGTPYVIVRARKKRATVEWDYLTLPEELDRLVASKEAELVAGFRVLVKKYGDEKSELTAGARLARFEHIANDQVDDLAEALFEFVSVTLGLAH